MRRHAAAIQDYLYVRDTRGPHIKSRASWNHVLTPLVAHHHLNFRPCSSSNETGRSQDRTIQQPGPPTISSGLLEVAFPTQRHKFAVVVVLHSLPTTSFGRINQMTASRMEMWRHVQFRMSQSSWNRWSWNIWRSKVQWRWPSRWVTLLLPSLEFKSSFLSAARPWYSRILRLIFA